jgi:hypothetical protein
MQKMGRSHPFRVRLGLQGSQFHAALKHDAYEQPQNSVDRTGEETRHPCTDDPRKNGNVQDDN